MRPKSASPLSSLDLFYDTNQQRAKNEYVLDLVVALLKENPDTRVNIAGHTDSNGADEYNNRLSAQRAEVVQKYLVRAGVNPSRITVLSYGESKPLTTNDTSAGRKFNRRTEIQFVKQ